MIRAVAKAAVRRGWEAVGILGGYDGLLDPPRTVPLDYHALDGLLVRGGTILGTANRGQFSAKTGHGEGRRLPTELLERTRRGMDALGLEALVAIGGDGSLAIAQQLHEYGIPVVGVPKTIDNDVGGTYLTFGFLSAVDCVTEAIDRLHTTAESHGRVMVRRGDGPLRRVDRALGRHCRRRGRHPHPRDARSPTTPWWRRSGSAKSAVKHFTLVVVAEGAREKGGDYVTSADQPQNREARLGGIGAIVSAEIERRTGKESRVCVLGHLQRGGTPSAFDRALCSMFGTEAMDLVAAGDFGKMVAYLGTHVGAIPIADAVGKLKTVPPDGDMSLTARNLGICLGD